MKTIKRAFLRNLLLIVAVVGFGLVVFAARHELEDTWELLKSVKFVALLALPLTQLLSYFFLSQYYKSMIVNFGQTLGNWRAFGTTTALNFVNQILPSGGASGITYVIYAYRDKVDGGKVTLIQLGRYVLAFLTYVPLLVIAMILLIGSGDFEGPLRNVLLILLAISLPGTILLIMAVGNQRLVDSMVGGTLSVINRLTAFVTRGRAKPMVVSRDSGFMKEFHDGVVFLRSQGHKIIKPYLFMQLSTIAEVLIVNLAFWSIGADISPGVLLVAFTAANVVGVISVIPGDVGVHELAMITVLGYVGVDQSTAIAGTLMYRVYNKVISLSIGFVCYVKFLKPLVSNAKSGIPLK